MKSIKFTNGKVYEILECYNNGMRYINGETRNTRDIYISPDVIGLDELRELLTDEAVVEVYMKEDREVDGELKYFEDTETLENFVYADEIKYKFNGNICFTIGQKTAIELENEQALQAIDELLIAMEV